MSSVIPPFCLLLALLMFIAGFALLAVDQPGPSTELHQARISGDEEYREVLEEQLRKQELGRNVLIAALFVSGGLSTIVAFLSMGPTKPRA